MVKRGDFMISTPVPEGYVVKRREPLPRDLAEFEQASAVADRLAAIERRHAENISETARRLEALSRKLDDFRKARGK
jgi:hypothetical protein